MFQKSQKITIIKIRKPIRHSINEDLQWFGSSLGLFGLRDKDKSCFRIFIELLKSAKLHKPLSSDDIANNLNLSRGTVIHHINKLIEAGIIIPQKNRYVLRVGNLEVLVDEIKKDIERTCEDLKEIAKEIDKWLDL